MVTDNELISSILLVNPYRNKLVGAKFWVIDFLFSLSLSERYPLSICKLPLFKVFGLSVWSGRSVIISWEKIKLLDKSKIIAHEFFKSWDK